jgi:hypothetical protein
METQGTFSLVSLLDAHMATPGMHVCVFRTPRPHAVMTFSEHIHIAVLGLVTQLSDDRFAGYCYFSNGSPASLFSMQTNMPRK